MPFVSQQGDQIPRSASSGGSLAALGGRAGSGSGAAGGGAAGGGGAAAGDGAAGGAAGGGGGGGGPSVADSFHRDRGHTAYTGPASGEGASAPAIGSGVFTTPDGTKLEIRDVWGDTVEHEMAEVRKLLVAEPKPYNYVAMDTEFPGVVARPIGSFSTSNDYQYQTLRCNVDLLKLIQVGVSFFNEDGEFAEGCPTWQFNFKFNLDEDMYAQDSIDMLVRSGINFQRHEDNGIHVAHFGELMMSSGLVLMPNVRWISFHSGYDFGYLIKLLTRSPLPAEETRFFDLLHTYFPCIYDIKYMMMSCDGLRGGLQKLGEDLNVTRIGPMHQAGSDSLLTAQTFFELKRQYFRNYVEDAKFVGYLYGLGTAIEAKGEA